MATKAPIVIIKRNASHGVHHGGAWKVAYADFVTAMMALFIVLWLMNTSKQIRDAVGGYFQDPTGTSRKAGAVKGGTGEKLIVSENNMERLKEELQKAIQQVPNFDKFKNHIDMTVTNEGLRIELTESAKGTFFESGRPVLNDDGRDIVAALAKVLGTIPNKVYVEGHTDATPYAEGSSYTNWELSADRANTTRNLMQENGVRSDQITEVRGFAAMKLRKVSDPFDPSNRRISLMVQYLELAAANDSHEQLTKSLPNTQPAAENSQPSSPPTPANK
jgi:chemotaxis protein MotB